MPRRCAIDPAFDRLVRGQDFVVHRMQALDAGMTRRAIDYKISRSAWQVLLPGVYLASPGEPSRRQMLIAAQLYAGELSAIDANDACRWHGIQAVAVDESLVHVVEPWGEPARSTGFVVVRRTLAPIRVQATDRLRYVDPATAVIAATRQMRSNRAVLAALSDAVQRRKATYDELVRAHIEGPPKGARAADQALASIGAGARSAPEVDFLKLVAASLLLPAPVCNVVLRIPGGRIVSPDALFVDAAVVHETNGRSAHRREDLFDDMQERHGALTDAGFEVFHSSPRQLVDNGRVIINRLERACERRRGIGLPPGVEIIAMAS